MMENKVYFEIPTASLIEWYQMTYDKAFLRLMDDKVIFAELKHQRRNAGYFKDLQNYELNEDLMNDKPMELSRNIAFEMKKLKYFIKIISGDYVGIRINEEDIIFTDISNPRQKLEIRQFNKRRLFIKKANDDSNQVETFINSYNKLFDFQTDDKGFVLPAAIDKTTYFLLESKEKRYSDNKHPCSKVRWTYNFDDDFTYVDLVERRKNRSEEYMDAFFTFDVIKKQCKYEVKTMQRTYFLANNLIKYINIRDGRFIALISLPKEQNITFLLRNNENLSTLSAIRATTASRYDDQIV